MLGGGAHTDIQDLNVALEENIGIFHKSPFPNLLSFSAPIKTTYIEDTFKILLISNTFLWQPLLQRKKSSNRLTLDCFNISYLTGSMEEEPLGSYLRYHVAK